MRPFIATILSLFLALPALAQTPAKIANPKTCDCPICLCDICDCGAKPAAKSAEGGARLTYYASAATSDADAAAALALALSEVASIPSNASNYASQRLLAVAARQHLIVGVNCDPPAGTWVSARSMDDDGTFASGKYIVVSYFDAKKQDLMTGQGYTKLPSNATEAEVAAALARLQQPVGSAVQYGQPVFYVNGGGACVGGNCGQGNMSFSSFGMGGCSSGSCGGGIGLFRR